VEVPNVNDTTRLHLIRQQLEATLAVVNEELAKLENENRVFDADMDAAYCEHCPGDHAEPCGVCRREDAESQRQAAMLAAAGLEAPPY
jgi:hypothetical protein